MLTVVLIIIIALLALGNIVLALLCHQLSSVLANLMRTMPNYRERVSGGTTGIYSPYINDKENGKN